MLYFAYGSNMDRAAMAVRCPGARARGRAVLEGWRFLINADGYATVVPAPGAAVHGVAWQISARNRAALDAYEEIGSGLYGVADVAIRLAAGGRREALIYVGRSWAAGRPRRRYLEQVLAAGRAWNLPAGYLTELARSARRWSPGAGGPDRGAEP